jgi:osmotically inducible protein OsmC
MPIKTAHSEWTGDFKSGRGTITPGSEAFEAEFSFDSIVREGHGTCPTELLGASIAGCFSGTLAAMLSRGHYVPRQIRTDAEVHLAPPVGGFGVMRIHLHTQAEVPGIDEATFLKYVEDSKLKCPVAQALSAIEITLHAELI